MWRQIFYLWDHWVCCDGKTITTNAESWAGCYQWHAYICGHAETSWFIMIFWLMYKPLNGCYSITYIRVILYPIKYFPFVLSLLYPHNSAFTWLYWLFSLSLTSSPLTCLSFLFLYPHLPSVCFINQWVVPLYCSSGSNQIHFGIECV